jgi:hypothetical protein
MSRIYTCSVTGTITAAETDVDLVEITPADDKPVKLVGFTLGQYSEVGDAAEEGIRLSIIRLPATVTSGSGGSSVTPAPLDSADAAAGATVEMDNTTVATTSGAAITLEEIGWNNRGSPLVMSYPDPALRYKVKGAESLVIRWQTTVADDVTYAFTAIFEEE